MERVVLDSFGWIVQISGLKMVLAPFSYDLGPC